MEIIAKEKSVEIPNYFIFLCNKIKKNVFKILARKVGL